MRAYTFMNIRVLYFIVSGEICVYLMKIKVVSITSKLFVCVEVLRPSQPSGVMSSAVSLPNHTFTGQA